MFEYITYLFNLIKNYFTSNTIKYNLPFDYDGIETNPNFNEFKNNDKDINKVIFALNNLPENIHSILFGATEQISNKFFFITIKLDNGNIYDFHHNLNDINNQLNNDSIKYILIRINIIDSTKNVMNHVNCIIIDKENKYSLFFEPKITFVYDVNDLTKIIDGLMNIADYKKLYPKDIGYNTYNKLQKYDAFCQSYILFVFIMIILNKNIKPENFCTMFNSTITSKNLGYLLFHINELLKKNNFDICDQAEIWSFPTNKTKNMFNLLHLFLNNKSETSKDEITDLLINEEDDIIIIDSVNI